MKPSFSFMKKINFFNLKIFDHSRNQSINQAGHMLHFETPANRRILKKQNVSTRESPNYRRSLLAGISSRLEEEEEGEKKKRRRYKIILGNLRGGEKQQLLPGEVSRYRVSVTGAPCGPVRPRPREIRSLARDFFNI